MKKYGSNHFQSHEMQQNAYMIYYNILYTDIQ